MQRATGTPGWQMMRRLFHACILLSWGSTIFAAGLGEIKLESGLNQDLFARVELLLAEDELVGNWVVALADLERYESMGIVYPHNANQIRVTLLQLASGRAEILIEGKRPVTDLIYDIVLILDDSDSIQVRHYPLLLDFPQLIEPVQQSIQRPVEVRSEPVQLGQPVPSPRRSQASQYQAGEGTYGPVQPGENLWLIANQVRGDSDINVDELMNAIFALNPDAFMGNDMNRLKVGTPLVLPDLGVDSAAITPRASGSEPAATVNRPGSGQTMENQSREPSLQSPPVPEPAARLELQGNPDDRTVAQSLDYWLEADNASNAENMSAIRRDLSFAAAEIETYSSENDILKARIDDLENRLTKLQSLLTLQGENMAASKQEQERELIQDATAPDQAEEATTVDTTTDDQLPVWTRYAILALVLLVLFVSYVVARNIREDRARKEKTADLVNRLKSAGRGTSLPDDY